MDALCRREEDGNLRSISWSFASRVDEIHTLYKEDLELQSMMEQFKTGELDQTRYFCISGFMFYKGRLYLSSNSSILSKILPQLHQSPTNSQAWHDFTGIEAGFLQCYVYAILCAMILRVWCMSTQQSRWCSFNRVITTIVNIHTSLGRYFHGCYWWTSYFARMVVVDRLSKYTHFIPLSSLHYHRYCKIVHL